MLGLLMIITRLISSWGIKYDFTEMQLTSVPVIDAEATKVHLTSNYIMRIEMTSFIGIPGVQKIFLTDNHIYYIDDEAFSSCPVLETLGFERNLVTILTPYGQLTNNLNCLQVDDNPLIYVPEGYFFMYTKLETLKITTHVPAFANGSPLARLVVSEIETVSDLSRLPNLVYIEMDNSNIICDWRLCWGVFEPFNINGRDPYVSPWSGSSYGPRDDLQLDSMECRNPPSWNGKQFREITPVELQCYKSKTFCLVEC